jgi:23S rRNA (cytosine1962-C5)-methyltransferase
MPGMTIEIHLKKGHDRRALAGHPWVFAGEAQSLPKDGIQPGDLAEVFASSGRFLGRGWVNPHSQILVRLLDGQKGELEEDFFLCRLREAQNYRRAIGYEPECYRLASSEGDRLPGLIVDRYGDRLVLQALTAGIHRRLEDISDALMNLLNPRGIYLKNDSPFLEKEGLPRESRLLRGEWPEPWQFELDGLKLRLEIEKAQKTGLFLDQTPNRRRLAEYAPGKRVLDLCCYAGLWSLQAARAGAASVLGIDSSAEAVARAQENARLNGLEGICRFERQAAFDALEAMAATKERFDIVVADPPAFVKSKTKLQSAIKGYEKLNRLALGVLNRPGLLVSCSCSYQLSSEAFLEMLRQTIRRAGCRGRLLHFLTQAPDHPVLLHVPESQYLKCAYVWVEE